MTVNRPLALSKVNVLVIDDDQEDFDLVSGLLKDKTPEFVLHAAQTMKAGFEFLSKSNVDIILLDLFLPDTFGLDGLRRLISDFPNVPIVVLSGLDNEQSALDAVQKGAQDYLVKGQIDGKRLSRVLLYAINRHEIQKGSGTAGLFDPLTGLYNRQGFITMADVHMKLAHRKKMKFFVCYAVLNSLKNINESFGKSEGSHALKYTAEILRETFRSSDVIARIGVNEFAIITSDQGGHHPKKISERIRSNKKFYNSQFNQYGLSLSMCSSFIDLSQGQRLKDLAEKTDKILADYRASRSA